MKSERYFWYLLPIFVAISGNLQPFRVGPVLPIYLLFAAYTLLNLALVAEFWLSRPYFAALSMVMICYVVFFAVWGTNEYRLKGDEFQGAIDPITYSVLALLRYILAICILIVLVRKPYRRTDYVYRSLQTCYLVLFVPLLIQAILFSVFDIEIGYVFIVEENTTRYGGFVGEPQTLAGWMFSFFLVLYLFKKYAGSREARSTWLLVASQIVALILTQSTAWILSFVLFGVINAGRRIRALVIILILGALLGGNLPFTEKIYAEFFDISERSVTVFAGYELFSATPKNVAFGYGLGLSPYVLQQSEWLTMYPMLNLSEFGRQGVMNSYLEIAFELGVVGALGMFWLLYVGAGMGTGRTMRNIAPLLMGVIGVGGGLVSGYMLLGTGLCVRLTQGWGARGAGRGGEGMAARRIQDTA